MSEVSSWMLGLRLLRRDEAEVRLRLLHGCSTCCCEGSGLLLGLLCFHAAAESTRWTRNHCCDLIYHTKVESVSRQ